MALAQTGEPLLTARLKAPTENFVPSQVAIARNSRAHPCLPPVFRHFSVCDDGTGARMRKQPIRRTRQQLAGCRWERSDGLRHCQPRCSLSNWRLPNGSVSKWVWHCGGQPRHPQSIDAVRGAEGDDIDHEARERPYLRSVVGRRSCQQSDLQSHGQCSSELRRRGRSSLGRSANQS